ncbi:hypothetical protein [Methanobacterium petrolearium]|nr:hypothetical protein GCM10025861_13720 [Methanobacterium petrolearium]
MAISTLIHTSDNIIGTFADWEADAKMGFNTLPIQLNPKLSTIIVFGLISSASIIIMFLWKLGLPVSYLPLAVIAIISLIGSSTIVLRNPEKFCSLSGFWIVYSFFMGEILVYMSLITF